MLFCHDVGNDSSRLKRKLPSFIIFIDFNLGMG